MKRLFGIMMASALLAACGNSTDTDGDGLAITEKFNSTWNIYETLKVNDDGSIVYKAFPWGGLIGTMRERNLPVDWSAYEAITVKFAQPTKVETQILVADKYKAWGKAGITSLTCNFDGQDVTSINEVTIQAADSTVLVVQEVRLIPATGTWKTIPLRTLECEFGDWANGFTLQPELFAEAMPGDKLEFIYTTDTSDPTIGDWLIKTIYNGTDSVLQGNGNELNQWGCAPIGRKSTLYRIALTDHDIDRLKKSGTFVNGRYVNITQCNLVRKESNEEQAAGPENY